MDVRGFLAKTVLAGFVVSGLTAAACVQTEPEHEWAQDELADLERMLEEEHASKEAPKDEQPPTDL